MFRIKIAEHVFDIDNRYDHVERLCADYQTAEPAEGCIRVSAEEMAKEHKTQQQHSEGYLEALAIYRKLCEKLLKEDILLFHASALMIDGKAYLFTAPSGTGKSTHARLWRETFGERVTMINDDKPLLRFTEQEIRVYGTPYAGKDRLQTNTSAPVAGIVLLHQAKENEIHRLTGTEAYPFLLNQAYRVEDAQGMLKTLDLVHSLSRIPVYALGCTISKEAAELAYQTVTEEGRQ